MKIQLHQLNNLDKEQKDVTFCILDPTSIALSFYSRQTIGIHIDLIKMADTPHR